METSDSSKKSKWRSASYAVRVTLAVIFTLTCYGTAIAIHRSTVIPAWIPWGVSLVAAALISMKSCRLFKYVVNTDNLMLKYLCSLVVMTGAVAALLYTCNFVWSDHSSRHIEQVTVTHRHTETRHRTKRVGRRHTTQGEPYNVYYIVLTFSNGKRKEQQVTLRQYNRLRTGSRLNIVVENGLLNVPVMKGGLLQERTLL